MFLKVYQDKTRGEVNFLSKVTVKVHKFKRQPHKMVKHTQTICRQISDELFKCF